MHGLHLHSKTKQKEAHMETRAATVQRVYEDFVPSHQLVQVEGIDTLVVELPEFKKGQIRAQLDNFGNLRLSGERPLGDNRWSRFRKDFRLPEDCNVSEIRAKFENGRLHVKLAKLVTEAIVKDRPTQAEKPKEDQKPIAEPTPSAGKDDMNQKATSRPPVEPNGVPKKQEDEKREEPKEMRQDAKKEGEKEKDQTEEKKDKEKVKPMAEPKPSTGKDDMNQKATSRPPVEPNGVPKKQQDEKREEPTETRKDAKTVGEKEKDQTEEKKDKEKVTSDVTQGAKKMGEKEKDQTEEKKGKEKVTSDVKHEEGEKGGAMADVPKKEAATTEHAAPNGGQNGQLKVGELGLGSYKQLVVNVSVAAVVLVGVGLYVTRKLWSPTVEDGH